MLELKKTDARGKVTDPMSKAVNAKSKTIDIRSKAINIKKCCPMVTKEYKRSSRLKKTNRLTKSTEKY